MRCQIRKLTTACAVLSLAFLKTCEPAADSYCSVYVQTIVEKGDGVIVGTPGFKRRTLANELTFRQLCPQANRT